MLNSRIQYPRRITFIVYAKTVHGWTFCAFKGIRLNLKFIRIRQKNYQINASVLNNFHALPTPFFRKGLISRIIIKQPLLLIFRWLPKTINFLKSPSILRIFSLNYHFNTIFYDKFYLKNLALFLRIKR